MKYDVVVIGTSAGGLDALRKILTTFKHFDDIALIIIQHRNPISNNYLSNILSDMTGRITLEIEDKTLLKKGVVYVVPPNYHALIEKNGLFTLDTSEKVCYARPSIDVTFKSFADAFGVSVIGIILTGANNDGGQGLYEIKLVHGYTIVQNPTTAEAPVMPNYAIKCTNPDEILELDDIGARLNELIRKNGEK